MKNKIIIPIFVVCLFLSGITILPNFYLVNEVEAVNYPDLTFNWNRFEVQGAQGWAFPVKVTDTKNENYHRWDVEFTVKNIGSGPAGDNWFINLILSGATGYESWSEDWGPTDYSLIPLFGSQQMHIEIDIISTDDRYDAEYTCIWVDLNSHRDEQYPQGPEELLESNYDNNGAWVNAFWKTDLEAECTTELTLYQTNLELSGVTLLNSVETDLVPEGWSVTVSPSELEIDAEDMQPMYVNITTPEAPFDDPTFIIYSEESYGEWTEDFIIFTDANATLEDSE